MAVEVTRAAPVAKPPATDPAVERTLPRSVRRQIERSEALQQELQPPADPDPNAPQDPPPPNGAASPAPQQDPPQPAPPAPQDPPQSEDWEQRYRSFEGRYRSDMQRSAERVMQLERELATRATPPQPTAPEQPLLSPEEIADYGPDFVNLVERVAQQSQRPLLQKITGLEAELQATGRRMAVSANDRMHEFMAERLPQWAAINNHPDFIAWSRLPDVFSGAIRQTLMQDAWNKGDGPRVEAFFRGFIAEQSALDPQWAQLAPAAPVQQPQPRPNGNGSAAPAQPRVTLESLAAPGRARSAPPQPADKPVYTQQQILKFYTDVATGRFGGTEADRAAIDADIIAAQHEGRILVDQRQAARPPAGFTR